MKTQFQPVIPIHINPYLSGGNEESTIVCPLCDGSHGDNSLCQMTWEDDHEIV